MTVPFTLRMKTLLGERRAAWLVSVSGVHETVVSRVLAGKRAPSSATIAAFATAFGISPNELVQGTDVADRTHEAAFVARRQFERVLADLSAALDDVEKWKRAYQDLAAEHQAANQRVRDELRALARSIGGDA